jgi:serine phosphatase RsbU (regulator of sigma subunit)
MINSELTNVSEEVKIELTKLTQANHDLVIRVVTVLNILFSISDYFTAPNFWVSFLVIRVIITTIFFSVYYFQEQLAIHPKWTLYIAYLGCIIENSYMYNVLDAVTLQKFTFSFITTFIGAGLFAIWNLRLSIAAVIFSVVLNAFLFVLLSPLSLNEFLSNGAFLTLMVAIFSVIPIHTRMSALIKEITYRFQLASASNVIANKNKNILDSIEYAKRIQDAMLPAQKDLDALPFDYFVFYQPKDIVSGDFYWFNPLMQQESQVMIAAIGDCTGHGVPGALMSILGMSSMQEIYAKDELLPPHQILDQLRKKITTNLKQTGELGEQKDGMDLGLIHYFANERRLEFAGANLPVWIVRQDELIELKGDRFPIGIHYGQEKPFTIQSINLEVGDWIYLFTDGFADQLGGELGKKYLSKNFKNLLLSTSKLTSKEQHESIRTEFNHWKNQLDQLDDVLVFGLRVQ